MKIHYLFILFVIFSANILSAQTKTLSDEDKEILKTRIVDKLEDFQYFLQTMADKRNSQDVRNTAYNSCINLFIGKCEPYEEYNDWVGIPIQRKAVQMQTSSINRPGKGPKQAMKQYLTRMLRGLGYSNIRIEQSDAIRVDTFRKLGDGRYMAIAYIFQDFIGYGNDGQTLYSDRTEKKVYIHIDATEIPTEEGTETIWDVKLGDMSVVSTQKI